MSEHQNSPFPSPDSDLFSEFEFPCPLCGTGLQIRRSCKEKPYCVCNSCSLQLFIRGKTGIDRLRDILETKALIVGKESETDRALVLYNHIQQLRGRRKILADQQGLIFRDEALEITIRAVDKEIERVQGELEKLSDDPNGQEYGKERNRTNE
jgi:hypothetical protein